MIESARFVNVSGFECQFNDDALPFHEFTTEVDERFTERVRPEQHGLFPANTWHGKRLFHVTGDIMQATSSDYWNKRRELLRAVMPRPQYGLAQAGTLYLQLSGMSEEVSADCTLDSYPELPIQGSNPSRGPFQIHWKAFDPRLYGEEKIREIHASVESSGRSYTKVYPKLYAGAGVHSDVTLVNAGDIESYPVIVVYGPVTTIKLERLLPDEAPQVVKLLGISLASAAESVTIDFASRTAFLADGTDVYTKVRDTTWWGLEPGENQIRYAGSGIGPGSKVVITYRNAYMI